MKRKTTAVLVLSVAMFGTGIETRADSRKNCERLRGSIAETRVPSNDVFGRFVGIVTGTLKGVSTVYITSLSPVASFDVFVTKRGDVLTAVGAPTRTAVPGQPGEFISHVDLTITGGSGKYAGATGTMTFDGFTHATVPTTVELIYQGEACGPNIKAREDPDDQEE